MTIEKIKQQLQRDIEVEEKLEAMKEDLNETGIYALGYWRGRISVLESLLEETENKDKSLRI